MSVLFKIMKFVMSFSGYLFGYLERVQGHSRMNGLVTVAAYWRRV